MEKLDAAGTADYIQKELTRLQKLADHKGAVAGRKLDELQLRQNILRAFESLTDSAQAVYDQAAEAVESATQRVKEEL
jgi:protein disulfide-isomerase A6